VAWTLANELKQWLGFDVPPLARRLAYTFALVLADVLLFQILVCRPYPSFLHSFIEPNSFRDNDFFILAE
jgi:hypothetical protein